MATAYESYVTGLSPLAYWPMNEASGDIVDVVAAANLAPNAGSFTYGVTSGVPTGLVKAIDIQADNATFSRFRKATPVSTATNNISVMLWANADDTASTARYLFDNGKNFAATLTGYAIRLNGVTNKLELIISGGAGTITSSGVMSEAAWHCIFAVRDAGTWTLYLDNASQGTDATAPTAPATATNIGNWEGNSAAANGWRGLVAHTAMWDRVLSASERANLYDYGLNGVPASNSAAFGGGVAAFAHARHERGRQRQYGL